MTPLVSVVMAAKNYARFLPQAVESVLAQSFADWELVIVDDGSEDDTPLTVQPYLLDKRIRYLRSDRLGQSRAKNLGIALSRGEFVAFLDADDAWMPTKLEQQLAVMQADAACGVCFCRRELMDEQGRRIASPFSEPAPSGRVLPAIFLRNFVCFSSVMIRRTIFERVGRFDPEWDLSIDYDLWLRVAVHTEFAYIDETLVAYRTGHGNLSKKLADRVAIADSIMTRALFRRGLVSLLPRRTIAEGYASTYRALGYTLRHSEPFHAARWYLRALAWPSRRKDALKGLIASMMAAVMSERVPGSAENAAVNR